MHLRPVWAKTKKEGKRQGKEIKREGRREGERKKERQEESQMDLGKHTKGRSLTDLWDSRISLKGEPLRTEVASFWEHSVRMGVGVGGVRAYMQGPQYDWRKSCGKGFRVWVSTSTGMMAITRLASQGRRSLY